MEKEKEKENNYKDILADNAATRRTIFLLNKNLVKLISILEDNKIRNRERGF